jgi:hypothetical protein
MNQETGSAEYRVCEGSLFVNGERVPVHRRILKIGLAAAGLETDACKPLSDHAARRILHLERSLLVAELTDEIRRALGPGRAA